MNLTERRAAAQALIETLEAVRTGLRDKHEAGTATFADDREAATEAASLNAQLQAVLTAGAQPCPDCETHAFGLMHESALGTGKGIRYTFEVGCPNPVCRDCRATDLLPELAVERWNAHDYDAPRAS